MIRYASVDAVIARSPVRKAVAIAILEEVIILRVEVVRFGIIVCVDAKLYFCFTLTKVKIYEQKESSKDEANNERLVHD